jgi:hypothetical protein
MMLCSVLDRIAVSPNATIGRAGNRQKPRPRVKLNKIRAMRSGRDSNPFAILARPLRSRVGFAKYSVRDRPPFAQLSSKSRTARRIVEKNGDKMSCRFLSNPFSPLGLSEKISQGTGNFFDFLRSSAEFLRSRD